MNDHPYPIAQCDEPPTVESRPVESLGPTRTLPQDSRRQLRFGALTFCPRTRELRNIEGPLKLGARATDILSVLVEQPGKLITKAELIARVWPNLVVEETNLRVHMTALRKVIAGQLDANDGIVNVVGRGYCFTAGVREEAVAAPGAHHPDNLHVHTLPNMLSGLIGRDNEIKTVSNLTVHHRCVTVLGPAGVGKSTLTLAVALKSQARFPDGARYIDCRLLSQPKAFLEKVALAVGFHGDCSISSISGFLTGKELLLLIDHCEHLRSEVAAAAHAILRTAAKVCILTASRQALGVEGECVQRLRPLAAPPAGQSVDRDGWSNYPAWQLFLTRAFPDSQAPGITPHDADLVAQISRCVDGIPLAIELAADRVSVLGLDELAAQLEQRPLAVVRGREGDTAHHRCLQAALDWSYVSLSHQEKAILQRLAVFPSAFTLESALVVAARCVDREYVLEAIISLADKSLIEVGQGKTKARYRLLNMTRAYALQKLRESGGYPDAQVTYWGRLEQLARDMIIEGQAMNEVEWIAQHEYMVSDLREIAHRQLLTRKTRQRIAQLLQLSVPLWKHLGLLEEWKALMTSAVPDECAECDPVVEARTEARRRVSRMAGSGKTDRFLFSNAREQYTDQHLAVEAREARVRNPVETPAAVLYMVEDTQGPRLSSESSAVRTQKLGIARPKLQHRTQNSTCTLVGPLAETDDRCRA